MYNWRSTGCDVAAVSTVAAVAAVAGAIAAVATVPPADCPFAPVAVVAAGAHVAGGVAAIATVAAVPPVAVATYSAPVRLFDKNAMRSVAEQSPMDEISGTATPLQCLLHKFQEIIGNSSLVGMFTKYLSPECIVRQNNQMEIDMQQSLAVYMEGLVSNLYDLKFTI